MSVFAFFCVQMFSVFVCICVFLLEGIQSDCGGREGKYEILS